MPIQITAPADGRPFGPGYITSFFTDSIGVIENGSTWRMQIRAGAGGETTVDSAVISATGPSIGTTFGLNAQGQSTLTARNSIIAQGEAATFTVELLNPQQVVIDSGSRAITYDRVSGVEWLAWFAPLTAPAGGGFTDADRQQLAEVKALAAFNLGAWLPELAAALQAAAQFPYGAELITPDRTGGGVLTRPGGGFNVNAFGIRYQVIDKPVGIGIDEGAPRSYELPMLELGLTGQVTGGDVVNVDSTWLRDENGTWVWNLNIPYQVLYWIQPGVTVRFWWLLFNPLAGDLAGPAEFLRAGSLGPEKQ